MAGTKFLAPSIILVFALFVQLKYSLKPDFCEENASLCIQHFHIRISTVLSVGKEAFLSAHGNGKRTAILDSKLKPCFLLLNLLLLCGDINLHPGPQWKYPCGTCCRPVKVNQRRIQCDSCDRWYHTKCCLLDDKIYNILAGSSCSWICPPCGSPNFSDSFFNTAAELNLDNSYSLLSSASDLSEHSQMYTPYCQPNLTTEKTPPFTSTPGGSRYSSKLWGMEINCNSIRSGERSNIFKAHIESYKPDIIFGCKSKLNQDIPAYSCFPPDYTVHRKDRSSSGGGVFWAVKSTIAISELPELNDEPDQEAIWASVKLGGAKELFLCSVYKPPSTQTLPCVNKLTTATYKIFDSHSRSHPNVIISGDLNLGDTDWFEDPPSTTNPLTSRGMSSLLEYIDKCAFTQHVIEPTRPASGRTLDLIISSTPALVSKVEIRPGMSDHDIVLFDINIKCKRVAKPPHKVYLYKRMDSEGLQESVRGIKSKFFNSSPDSRSTNKNWMFFKQELQKSIDMHVPYKITKAKSHLPWLSRTIKRHMRKRDKLLKKARHSRENSDWSAYRKQRNKVVNLMKSSYNDYIFNIIGGSLSSNPKRFWSHLKMARTENIEIPTLKENGIHYI